MSRRVHVPAHEVSSGGATFLEGGAAKLKRRTDGTDWALREAQAKVGELTMECPRQSGSL